MGKINISDSCAYVAIARDEVGTFEKWLAHGKLKNRAFKAV